MVLISKLSYTATLASSVIASVTPGGMASMYWSVRGTPKTGVDKLSFSFMVHSAVQKDGYYMAMQYTFLNREKLGYTGIQPHADGSARALFSVFGPEATVVDKKNCYKGADGGEGVSCAVPMSEFKLNKRYYFVVERDSYNRRVWRGTVTDLGEYRQEIGAWQLGPNVGALNSNGGQVGFLEYYRKTDSCATTPYIDGTWYAPRVDDPVANPSRAIGKANIYGKCKGGFRVSQSHFSNYDATRVRAGY